MNKLLCTLFFLTVLIGVKSQDTLSQNQWMSILVKAPLIKLEDLNRLKSNKNNSGKVFRLIVREDQLKKTAPAFESLEPGVTLPEDVTKPPVVFPSPSSAALASMVNENVDLYTGKATINLPIYTLKSGAIEVPIYLSGNVNAHKVNDIGTNVGMGFNLNTGGSITRVMRSLPDEFTGTISSSFNFGGYGYIHIKNLGVNLTTFDDNNPSTQTKKEIIAKGNWNVTKNQPASGWDLQPDEFYFNFGNYSGKFLFNQDGEINLIPESNVKITPTYEQVNGVTKIIGFTALTEDGFKYEFGNTSPGNFSQAPLDESKLTSSTKSMHYTYRGIGQYDPGTGASIYLVTIEDGYPYYCLERIPYVLSSVPTQQYGVPVPPVIIPPNIWDFDAAHNNESIEYFHYPSTWHLAKITSPTGDWVSYSYSGTNSITYITDRSFSANVPDLADRLVDVNGTIYNLFQSAMRPIYDNAWRKIFTLPEMQSFTESRSTINLLAKKLQTISTSDNTIVSFNSITPREDLPGDNRLDNIVVTNSSNALVKKINLAYNTIETTASDHPLEQFSFTFRKSAYNYNPAATYIGMGSVAGGFQKTFDVPDYFRKRMFLASLQEEGNGISQPPYQLEYNTDYKLPYRGSTEQDFFGYANNNPTRHPFVSIGYSYYLPYFGVNSYGAPAFSNPILFFSTLNAGPSTGMFGGSKAYSLDKMKSWTLKKIVYPTGGYKEFSYAVNGNNSGWSGLRVSEVKEFNSAGATPIVKNYSYGNFVNADGVILNYSMAASGTIYANALDFPTKRIFFSQSRVNAEKDTRGAAGGYDFVENYQAGNGKTKSEYYTPNEYPDVTTNVRLVSIHGNPNTMSIPSFPFPFHRVNSLDRKRGFPKKDFIFLEGSATPLKYNEYSYLPDPSVYVEKEIPELTVSKYNVSFLDPLNGAIVDPTWPWHLFGKTIYTSGWYHLIGKKTRVYDQNGTNYSESTQEFDYRKYTYNNKDYLFQYQQKDLKNSRNEQTVSYSKYPLDYSTANIFDPVQVGMENLKTKHVLNAKIEQFSWKQDQNGNNKKYIGGILNKYHTDKPLAKEVFKLRTNGLMTSFTESNTSSNWFAMDPNYNSEVQFPMYDANGRIQEQNKTNDIKETYIWNYNKMYPVAKTVNANQGEVAFSSFEADETNSKINFIPANVVTNASIAHTGRKYYSLNDPNPLNANITTNISPIINNTYKLSLWANGGDIMIWHVVNGTYDFISIPAPIKTRSNWNYYEITMPSNFNGIAAISKRYSFQNVFADEVRLIPSLSQMNTYTFDPLIGMTSETDVNGKTVYYEYDKLNRLTLIKNEDKDIVKRICYNYAGLVVPCDQ